MGPTGRRLARLTLDTLADLPDEIRTCVFWELDPVRRARAVEAGEAAGEKGAWLSRVLLDWGWCGRVAYVDGTAVGFAVFAPPMFFPGSEAMPTAPVGEDAVLLATAYVAPDHAGGGIGRMLMQGVVKDLVKRGGIRAVEAFGDTRAPRRGQHGTHAADGHSCVLPADYLLRVGFKTQRPHPRYPRMRLELKSAVTWRSEVEHALERLLGVVRPTRPAPAPHAPTPRESLRDPR
jgi:GNAT superfamily N-acetyltransferase